MLLTCSELLAQPQDSLEYFHQRGLSALNSGADSSIFYFQQAAQMAEERRDMTQLSLSLNRLGLANKNHGKAKEALEFYRQSLRLRRDLNDSAGVASVLNNMGNVHKVTGQLDSALYYALLCLDLRRGLGLAGKLSSSYLNIGNLYNLKKDSEKAMHYYKLAETLASKQQDDQRLALALYNIAAVLSDNTRHGEAIEHFEKSLELQKKQDNPLAIARIYNGMGVSLERQGRWDQAEARYHQSLEMLALLNAPEDLAAAYLNLGNLLHRQQESKAALSALKNGLKVAREAELEKTASEIHYNLYRLHADNEQWKEALDHFQRHKAISDSLNTAESARAFSEIREKYESEQKERLIDAQQASLEQKNLENKSLLFGFALLTIVGLSGFVIYRQQTRNRTLKAERQAVEDQQRIMGLLQEKEVETIEAMLKGQSLERHRIARDLHDQLGGIMATVKLHFNSMEDSIDQLPKNNQQSFEKANQVLDVACNEVRIIAHDMVSGMLTHSGLQGALQELVKAVEKKAGLNVQLLINQWDESLDDGLELDLYRTIQELISNVLRHAQATELTIQLTRNEDGLSVMVEDNGVGFEPGSGTRAIGMGLKNMENRMHKHGGSFSIDSTLTHGTTVIIDIPLPN